MQPAPSTLPEKIAEVTAAYYQQMAHFRPAERDLIDWFVQLGRAEKTAAAGVAYGRWAALPGFQRHYLEKKGHSLPAYLARHLTAQEFAQWVDA